MDLRLIARVAWRFRWVLTTGLVLSVVMGFLAAYRVSADGITRRGVEQWSSSATLLVTQPGFPETRATFPVIVPPPSTPGQSQTYIPAFGDPGRLLGLAGVYAKLAISNEVRRAVLGDRIADPNVAIEAEQLTNRKSESQPFFQLTGIDTTPKGAVAVRDRTIEALQRLLTTRQQSSGTPEKSRVVLEDVVSPELGETGAAQLLSGRSKTLPIALVLLGIVVTFGLAFLLENLQPRIAAALGITPGLGSGDTPVEPPSVEAQHASEPLEQEASAVPDEIDWSEIARESR